MNCPCGSGHLYQACCGRYINGGDVPQHPEALMRSRYTAYTLSNVSYIAATMKAPASERFDDASARAWAESVQWGGLSVLKAMSSGDEGQVEFVARYHENGKQCVIHEVSAFKREMGRWYYVDGYQPKVGRNDPCPCGSGKKYKKCCL